MNEKIKEIKIFYHGIIKDNIKFYKRVPSKLIVLFNPKERYVIDITYIPIDLLSNKKMFKF